MRFPPHASQEVKQQNASTHAIGINPVLKEKGRGTQANEKVKKNRGGTSTHTYLPHPKGGSVGLFFLPQHACVKTNTKQRKYEHIGVYNRVQYQNSLSLCSVVSLSCPPPCTFDFECSIYLIVRPCSSVMGIVCHFHFIRHELRPCPSPPYLRLNEWLGSSLWSSWSSSLIFIINIDIILALPNSSGSNESASSTLCLMYLLLKTRKVLSLFLLLISLVHITRWSPHLVSPRTRLAFHFSEQTQQPWTEWIVNKGKEEEEEDEGCFGFGS